MGVDPTRKPVFRSWDVAPALAAAIQTIAPTQSAAPWYASPPIPSERKISVVPSSVAMVIPEIGFEELPINPTILEETATKKNPKIRIRREVRRLPGKFPVGRLGRTEMIRARPMAPARTQLIGMSLSVRLSADAVPPASPRRSRT